MSPEPGKAPDDPNEPDVDGGRVDSPPAFEDGDATETADVESEPLGPDEVFNLLKNVRKRYALRALDDTDDSTSLSELTEQVAAWQNDKPISELTSDERKRVYIALYQSHLPELEQKGIVDYDQSRGIVEPHPEAISNIESYISIPVSEFDDEWTTTTSASTLSSLTGQWSRPSPTPQWSRAASLLLMLLVVVDGVAALTLSEGVVGISVLAMPFLMFCLLVVLVSERRSVPT